MWTSAQDGESIKTQTLRLTGLNQPVTVSFTKQGPASIMGQTDHDLFLALGYVHAEFRPSELDDERRLWAPVDSLVIQGDLTESLDFTTTPLDYALLERSLGAARTMAWFPVIAPNAQSPYDPGPYLKPKLVPLANARSANISATEAQAAAGLFAEVSQLPPGQVHEYGPSNAWASNVQEGQALLALAGLPPVRRGRRGRRPPGRDPPGPRRGLARPRRDLPPARRTVGHGLVVRCSEPDRARQAEQVLPRDGYSAGGALPVLAGGYELQAQLVGPVTGNPGVPARAPDDRVGAGLADDVQAGPGVDLRAAPAGAVSCPSASSFPPTASFRRP